MPWEIALAATAIAVGAFVQTSIGFGMAIVAAPFLFYLNPAYIPAPMILATLANVMYTAWFYRADLRLRDLTAAIIARVPGSLAGVALLLLVSVEVLAVLIAVIIVAGIVLTYVRLPIAWNRRNLAAAGFLSGFMGTSTSIGGPPMAFVLQSQGANVRRGNLGAFFVFSSLVSLLFLLPAGRLGALELQLGLPLVPAAWLGSWMAARVSHRFSETLLRRGTMVLCSIAVANMLVQYLSN